MGCPDPNILADCMSPELLAEWQAFYSLEPWDSNYQAAALKAFLVNATRQVLSVFGVKDDLPAAMPTDFLSGSQKRKARKKKESDLARKLNQHARVLGAKIGRSSDNLG